MRYCGPECPKAAWKQHKVKGKQILQESQATVKAQVCQPTHGCTLSGSLCTCSKYTLHFVITFVSDFSPLIHVDGEQACTVYSSFAHYPRITWFLSNKKEHAVCLYRVNWRAIFSQFGKGVGIRVRYSPHCRVVQLLHKLASLLSAWHT